MGTFKVLLVKVENVGGTIVGRKEGIDQMGSKTKLQNIDL